MITFKPPQDMFKLHADYYVNAVNNLGVSGAGVAAAVRELFPKTEKKYVKLCKENPGIKGGSVHIIDNIAFAFTKEHYMYPSRYEWIEDICAHLNFQLSFKEKPCTIISPALGCRLRWFRLENC